MRQLQGSDLAIEALKRLLGRGGQPSGLLRTAWLFPRTLTAIREALRFC